MTAAEGHGFERDTDEINNNTIYFVNLYTSFVINKCRYSHYISQFLQIYIFLVPVGSLLYMTKL